MQTRFSVAAVLAAIVLSPGSQSEPNQAKANMVADTIYTNARIYTVNPEQSWAEALAIKDGRFLRVGSASEVAAHTGETTQVVDLGGRFVMPGVVDAHIHPYDVYLQKYMGNLQVSDQLNAEELAAAIRQFAAENPDRAWIKGSQYGLGAFPGGKMHRDWLDEMVPNRPAYIVDESGHNATANSRALEIAGIDAHTPDPELGAIEKDPESGEPTGYLSETGMGLVGKHLTRATPEQYREAIVQALSEMQAWGITSFIDMLATPETMQVYFDLQAEQQLPFRLNAALAMNEYTNEVITPEEARSYLPRAVEQANEQVNTAHFKFWGDGTPISYTSLMIEPYADKDTLGELTMTDRMRDEAIEYLGKGIGGHIHSITDGTARFVLDLVEEARKRHPGKVRRFHVGHNQLVHPDDFPRYVALDVVAEIGPAMWYPSPIKPLIEAKFGAERSAQYFNVRAMLDAGVTVAWGSDWPAGTPDANPFRGLEGLVTRKHPWGQFEGVWGTPISLEEGLHIITMGGAYAMELEDEIGSIQAGKHADFIVLNRNLFDIEPEQIDKVEVLQSVFAGRTAYRKD
jgi:predicted amidohydrolase YtcJ